MDKEDLLKQEQLINIDGQWFQRGNMSRSWLAVASHPDGSCRGGICERVPSKVWPILEEVVYLRSLLTEQDGMVLVPKEPTEDMLIAYAEAVIGGKGSTWIKEIAIGYRAMLAAAPTPPAQGDVERRALEEIRELWAGAEVGEPVYAQEAYAIGLCKRMYRIAVDALATKQR